MKNRLLIAPCAVAVALAFGATMQVAQAARGGRGGGFSRESPAAGGGLSARPYSAPGRQSGAQVSRQQSAARGQANREQITGMKSSTQQYHGTHVQVEEGWDAGRGIAVATGVAIGAAAANSGAAASGETVTPGTSAPCAAPTVVSAGNMTYFGCGSLWYTEAYGPSGPTFVQVAAPGGY
jgi:hypothetical protein